MSRPSRFFLRRSIRSRSERLPRGMGGFLFLPHVFFVAEYGLEHFETSMRAQYVLTQRFTAEFSIRRYLERHQAATLGPVSREWSADASEDVRRLVSEGTRPRLPWAPRLRAFQADPRPVLALLERLKDDPSLYVRRSVANNLNDIGKDHPVLLVETATRWMENATEERRWIIRHALRSGGEAR
jgi:3-methyladenine DNA glycosylase AlkC